MDGGGQVKTPGGLDSVGAAVGPAILDRARAELAAAVGPAEAERLAAVGVDVGDCARPWWAPPPPPHPPFTHSHARTRAHAHAHTHAHAHHALLCPFPPTARV